MRDVVEEAASMKAALNDAQRRVHELSDENRKLRGSVDKVGGGEGGG